MKTTSLRLILPLALLAGPAWVSAHSFRLTVTTAQTDTTPDAQLTLPEAILFLNGEFSSSPEAPRLDRPLSVGESQWVEEYSEEEGQNIIQFNISGAGMAVLKAPPGGFPVLFADGVLIDGYTQPGAQPNSNPITAPNNAVLKLILDARELTRVGDQGAPDYSFQIQSRDARLRGFSVLASTTSENYGIYFSGSAAGGQISGCWFGISPDQTILSGGEVATAAFGTEGGHVFGTDGDGNEDRAEFNVIVAHAIGVMFEETANIRVSGNFIGVLPDGVSLPPEEIRAELEGDAIEGADLTGTIWVGTNSDGMADAEEANLIGGMKDDVVELYGNAETFIFAGNQVGIGIDGTTALPVHKLIRTRAGQFQIGSNLDGLRDATEANWIAHNDNFLVRYVPNGFFSLRGNRLTSKAGPFFTDLANSQLALALGRETDLAPVLSAESTLAQVKGTVPLSGPGAGGLQPAQLDFYRTTAPVGPLDPPLDGAYDWSYLGSRVDNGPGDLDPAEGKFQFDLQALVPSGDPVRLMVLSTLISEGGIETGPPSNVISVSGSPAVPQLQYSRTPEGLVLTWTQPGYTLESASTLGGAWVAAGSVSPVIVPLNGTAAFFRLRGP